MGKNASYDGYEHEMGRFCDSTVITSAITGVVHFTRDGNLTKLDLNTYLK